MKIGFFDSGLGGLTVFNKAIEQISEEYIYMADNKNTPYGIKEKEEVRGYIFNCIDYLVKKGCKIVVIACNTATSIAIDDLRKMYKDVTMIGTEPAIKVALDENINSKILVFATSTTVKEEKVFNLIKNLDAKDKVDLVALDKLVKFAEAPSYDEVEVKSYIMEQIKNLDIQKYTHIVLGCTHFPLFRQLMSEIFNKDTHIIDGSIGIVNNLKSKIKENVVNLGTNSKITTLVITKNDETFITNFKKISKLNDFYIEIME